jgi:hypothetical protein
MFEVEYFNEFVYRGKVNRLRENFIKKNFIDFYNFINNSFKEESFLEKLYSFVKGDINKCYCGNKTKFISFTKGYLEYCSIYCSSNSQKTRDKYKKTCLEKYGVNNVSNFDEIKKKKKNTFIDKYGVSTYLQTKEVKEKMISKHGVDNPFKLKEVQDKIKITNLHRYGYECSLLSPEVKKKSIKTNINKYGVDHFSKTEIWKENMKKINDSNYINSLDLPDNYEFISKKEFVNIIKHLDCDTEFEIQTQLIRLRKNTNSEICKNCNSINYKSENDLLNYIKSIYDGEVIKYRDKKYEIDIYLPELNLGFEFNGLYWHSELFKNNNYHLDKMIYFKDNGIRIVNIWEDDWSNKTEIVKSIIKSNILIFEEKIQARKCIFSEISNKDCKKFLNDNHIQGWCISKYRYGLIYNNEIVSVLTIGSRRLNLGYKGKNDSELEILRFCNKINTRVIGGFSKLFKNSIKKLNFDKIITYSDSSIFTGDVYVKSGFNLIGQTEPGYSYIVNRVRKNRFNFNKSKLIKMGFDKSKTEREIMFGLNFYRIYDCGNFKFEYSKI